MPEPSDITVGIIGLGSLGIAISEALCDSIPDYKRVNRLLLLSRDQRKTASHINDHLQKRVRQRVESGLGELVLEHAPAETIAKDANLVFMCVENKYGTKNGIPYWESDFRKKLFNGNIGAIQDYARIFKNSDALVMMLTNPNVLMGYFFQQLSQMNPEQVISPTNDTQRAQQILDSDKASKGARGLWLGDHGPDGYLHIELPENIQKPNEDALARVRSSVLTKGLDLAHLFGTTTNNIAPDLLAFLKSILKGDTAEYVFGITHQFDDGMTIGCQLPLGVKEVKPGSFRASVTMEGLEGLLSQIEQNDQNAPDKKLTFKGVREKVWRETAQISPRLKCTIKSTRPLIRYLRDNTLRIYSLEGDMPAVELSCPGYALCLDSLDERVATITTDQQIKAWKLPATTPLIANLPRIDADDTLLKVISDGYLVIQSKDGRSVLTRFAGEEILQIGAQNSTLFAPTAVAYDGKAVYLADNRNVYILNPNDLKDIKIYQSINLDENEKLDRLWALTRKGSNYLFAVTDSRIICWADSRLLFEKKANYGPLDVFVDHTDEIMVLSGIKNQLQLEMLKDRQLVQIDSKDLRAGEILSVCFDPEDNYAFAVTQSNLISLPYWKQAFVAGKEAVLPVRVDSTVRDVRYTKWA